MSGSHYDRSRVLKGTLTVRDGDFTPPAITPEISGTRAPNGVYTSDVEVSWDIEEPGSPYDATGCETQTVTADTAGITFTCSATSHGGTTSKSVTVKRDVTAPVLTVPDLIVRRDAPPNGIVVDYAVSATDSVDAAPAVKCSPASGTVFPAGSTTVSCTATDATGHTTTKTFEVAVIPTMQAAAPPADPPTPVAAAQKLAPVVSLHAVTKTKFTRVKRLTLKNLPKGSSVRITCKGKSCPKALKRGVTRGTPTTAINLSKLVKGQLKPGTVFTIVVTAPDGQKATKRVTVRKGLTPKVR